MASQSQSQSQLQQQLLEVGKKLQNYSSLSKHSLLKLLSQVANYLSKVDQSPSQMMLNAMHSIKNILVSPGLLRPNDEEVAVLVAACISEIMRITAPEAPYSDNVLREIFSLLIDSFRGLVDLDDPQFERRTKILETVAKIKLCVLMLDLECNSLVFEIFKIFFSSASERHQENVLTSMINIMGLILNESENISEELLSIILGYLVQEKHEHSSEGSKLPGSYKLAINVIKRSIKKLEPHVSQFVRSEVMLNENFQGVELCHIIYDLCKDIPQISERMIPFLKELLLNNDPHVRKKAVKLLGGIFIVPRNPSLEVFKPLLSDFITRFSDKDREVHLSVADYAKQLILCNRSSPEASSMLSALESQLVDDDYNIRRRVVGVICDIGCQSLQAVSLRTFKLVIERLHDKEVSVRIYTMERLLEIYSIYFMKRSAGENTVNELEWIPFNILKCCSERYIRPQALESAFSEILFASAFPVVDRVKQWICLYSKLGKFELKALGEVLSQKKQLQYEMKSYLLLRHEVKDGNELRYSKQIANCLKCMSLSFEDPEKALDQLQRLNEINECDIWGAFARLVDPNMTLAQADETYVYIVQRFNKNHPLHEFVKKLARKCSYQLFSKEHIKELLHDISSNKDSEKDDIITAGTNLLAIFSENFPSLFEGFEEAFLELMKEDNESIKEGVLHILSKIGRPIDNQVTDTAGSLDLLLEALCLEGNRKQAKYSVQALTRITKDSGLRALSVLYKQLVDKLETGTHLPTILQSLGCIAQNAMPVFETREEEVVLFVYQNIFRLKSDCANLLRTEKEEISHSCLLKIYGIKTLVRSYLPNCDAHLRQGIKVLLDALSKFLVDGVISEGVQLSDVDRAHLKLASAKGVLRLSRQWHSQISPEVFEMTLNVAQDPRPDVRQDFLAKVHQYLNDQVLDNKYACAFALGTLRASEDEIKNLKQYFHSFVEACYEKVKTQNSVCQLDSQILSSYPQYVLVYLIHCLAHDPMFPDFSVELIPETFEPFNRAIHFAVDILFQHANDIDNHAVRRSECLSVMLSIFNAIKYAEDAIDESKSQNLLILCEIGISLTLEMVQDYTLPPDFLDVCLPNSMYRKLVHARETDVKAVVKNLTRLSCKTGSVQYPASHAKNTKEVAADAPESKKALSLLKTTNLQKIQAGGKYGNLVNQGHEEMDLEKTSEVKVPNSVLKIEGDKIHDETSPKNGVQVNHGAISSPEKKKRRKANELANASANGTSKGKHLYDNELCQETKMEKSKQSPPKFREKSKPDKGWHGTLPESSSGISRKEVTDKKNQGKRKSAALAECVVKSSQSTSQKTSSSVAFKMQKSILGLHKNSTSRQQNANQEQLIGCRIKVWWPLDKQFYDGIVESYDSVKKKHRILYDDGDVEILRLDREKWKLINDKEKLKMFTSSSLEEQASMHGGGKLTTEGLQVNTSANKLADLHGSIGRTNEQTKQPREPKDIARDKKKQKKLKSVVDDGNHGFSVDPYSRDSDEEPLSMWLSRRKKL